mmetsp:Transcript_60832/g.122052  ORF Transcript_60832/g.122052 Transcript_60832/m.122052 type:complete len:239 (-) Transcript_60832:81-797(-)
MNRCPKFYILLPRTLISPLPQIPPDSRKLSVHQMQTSGAKPWMTRCSPCHALAYTNEFPSPLRVAVKFLAANGFSNANATSTVTLPVTGHDLSHKDFYNDPMTLTTLMLLTLLSYTATHFDSSCLCVQLKIYRCFRRTSRLPFYKLTLPRKFTCVPHQATTTKLLMAKMKSWSSAEPFTASNRPHPAFGRLCQHTYFPWVTSPSWATLVCFVRCYQTDVFYLPVRTSTTSLQASRIHP